MGTFGDGTAGVFAIVAFIGVMIMLLASVIFVVYKCATKGNSR
jgi:hypothetical protein